MSDDICPACAAALAAAERRGAKRMRAAAADLCQREARRLAAVGAAGNEIADAMGNAVYDAMCSIERLDVDAVLAGDGDV